MRRGGGAGRGLVPPGWCRLRAASLKGLDITRRAGRHLTARYLLPHREERGEITLSLFLGSSARQVPPQRCGAAAPARRRMKRCLFATDFHRALRSRLKGIQAYATRSAPSVRAASEAADRRPAPPDCHV